MAKGKGASQVRQGSLTGIPLTSRICPEATAPAAMPKKTGVTVLATAKTRSQTPAPVATLRAGVRKMKAAPAEDDPQQSQRERDVERDAERGEDGWEDR